MSTHAGEAEPSTPNHHAHHRGFTGPFGVAAALSMAVGRTAGSRLAADLVDLQGGDRLVDVGCGPGTAARFAAARGARVVGVDPAPVMLRTARLLSVGRPGPDWREGGAEDLPVGDDDATVLWALATVHHWPDLDGALSEARRVLRPGGRLLAAERRRDPGASGLASHGWTDRQADAFADLVSGGGFEGVEVQRAGAGRDVVLAVRAIAP